MPIRAIVDGQDIILSLLSYEDCVKLQRDIKLKKLSVVMPCCNSKGHLKFSVLNNAFFCHNKNQGKNCNSKPESEEHRRLKGIIHRACIDAGFDAIPEYTGNKNYQPDVFATKDDLKIAFEVQLSPQSYLDTLVRQKKYDLDNVHCCWLFKKLPQSNYLDSSDTGELSMFELAYHGDDEINVVDENFEESVYDFVQSYLKLKIQLSKLTMLLPNETEAYQIADVRIYSDEEIDVMIEILASIGKSIWKWVYANKEILITALIIIILWKIARRK